MSTPAEMELIDANQLCKILGFSSERKSPDGPVPSGLQRAYRMASEPSKFDLPPNSIVRIGRQVRFRRDLIERWIEAGGTQGKAD